MEIEKTDDNGKAEVQATGIMISQKAAAIGQFIHELHNTLHACETFAVRRKAEVMQIPPLHGSVKPAPVPTGNFMIMIKVEMPKKVKA